MIVSVTPNPSVDYACFVERIALHDSNRILRTETDAGGKGVNLSRIVAELGGPTTATGFLGGDTGAFVRTVLAHQGVRERFVRISRSTRINFSVEGQDGEPPTTFNDRGPTIEAEEIATLLGRCKRLLKGAWCLAAGGSLPPGVPLDFYFRLGEIARSSGIRYALDADGDSLRMGLHSKPYLIKPNAKEAERLLGYSVDNEQSALRAAIAMHDLGAENVIVSRGAHGAVLSTPSGQYCGDSPRVEAKSTVGSGDSMLGGYLWAMSNGADAADALRWGMAAGAATAMTDGSCIGSRSDMETLFQKTVVRRVP